jgi:hypothetical protein
MDREQEVGSILGGGDDRRVGILEEVLVDGWIFFLLLIYPSWWFLADYEQVFFF